MLDKIVFAEKKSRLLFCRETFAFYQNNLDMSHPGKNSPSQPDSGLDVLDQVETEEPPLYKVLLLNDDYTPMDFVIYVLKTFFKHDDASAEKIMLDVHKLGSGVAGIYNFEAAETKSMQVNQFAKSNKYPLKSTVEEDQ